MNQSRTPKVLEVQIKQLLNKVNQNPEDAESTHQLFGICDALRAFLGESSSEVVELQEQIESMQSDH